MTKNQAFTSTYAGVHTAVFDFQKILGKASAVSMSSGALGLSSQVRGILGASGIANQLQLSKETMGLSSQVRGILGASGIANQLQLSKETIGLSSQVSEIFGFHHKSLVSMATASGLASTLTSWSTTFQGNVSLASAAVEFQRSNAAVASTLAAVAAQRVAAYSGGVRGSFDGQFAAVARRISVEDIPVSLREQLTNLAEDPQTLQAAAANAGLSDVPAGQKDRWLLELLVGFAFTILYGFVQVGMTGDPVTPALIKDSLEFGSAGGIGIAAVRWAPGLLEKLRKADSSDG